jgi:hypothetical protein
MRLPRSSINEMMEALMTKEWFEAAGFLVVIAACYMMVIPV